MTDDLKHYRALRRPWLWIVGAAFAVAVLTYIGPVQCADDLATEAELKVQRAELAAQVWRAPQAEITESYMLTHPLSCDGTWVKSCADFGPCRIWCNGVEERP